MAAKLGASTEIVNTIRNGGSFSNPKLEAVRRFTAAVASKRSEVSDSDVKELVTAGYDRRAAVALALAAAAKTLLNAVAHLAHPTRQSAAVHSGLARYFKLYIDVRLYAPKPFEHSGGEGGIRTLGTGVSPYNGLANRRIRPLCHLSGAHRNGPLASVVYHFCFRSGPTNWLPSQPSRLTAISFAGSSQSWIAARKFDEYPPA